jgi:hypothetical protein
MEHKLVYIDFYCNHSDHFFSIRFIDVKDNSGFIVKDDEGNNLKLVTRVKLSLRDANGVKNYLKVNFEDDYFQVWTKNSKTNRHTINMPFNPDFSDRNALLRKIKTYLMFA